ncbi:hypothetical protein ACVWY3_007680 [Bradyrhizobium sp. USDA 4486]
MSNTALSRRKDDDLEIVLDTRHDGRSRRYTISLHGVWTAQKARQEAKVQLGRVAQSDNPAEERQLDRKAITVKELCALYLNDLNAGPILGKGGRPKKPSTIISDTRRIRALYHPASQQAAREGQTKADIKGTEGYHGRQDASLGQDKKLRGKVIVRSGNADGRASWRHSHVRRRGGNHRHQSLV